MLNVLTPRDTTASPHDAISTFDCELNLERNNSRDVSDSGRGRGGYGAQIRAVAHAASGANGCSGDSTRHSVNTCLTGKMDARAEG